MSVAEALIPVALLLPLGASVLTFLLGKVPDVRDTLTMVMAISLAVVCGWLFIEVGNGARPVFVIGEPVPGLTLGFHVEPLGALFAAMASGLWAVNSLFAIGYMRGKKEDNQTRFYICFGLAIAGAMGVAMAENLFTLFVFYEVLTLSTYPLVTHAGDAPARRAGRIYLGTLVGASVLLFLPAIIAIFAITGTTEFTPGGVLYGKVDPVVSSILLVMLVFGVAKAAMFPLHYWLPTAMVAPTPVSALLHAVAVVKAGAFTLLKVSAYIFGSAQMSETPAAEWLLWLAAAMIVISSIVAITKDQLKARLAWSTIGQLAYMTAAALMAGSAAVVAGGVHMLTHAFGKITLFMCAGAIYVATSRTKVSELSGMGRSMPWLFAAWTVGALSVSGLPPFGGMWSKFLLMEAAVDRGYMFVVWALIGSSLLSVYYLVSISFRAFLPPPGEGEGAVRIKSREMVRLCVVALCLTALGAFLLFFLADGVAHYLAPIGEEGP